MIEKGLKLAKVKSKVKNIKDSAMLHKKAQGQPLGKPRPEHLGTKGNPCMSVKR